MSVESVPEATKQAIAVAEKAGGHVRQSSTSRDAASRLELRVPAEDLDAVLDQLASLGEEIHRTVVSADVTDELADLDAELANHRALRDRLRQLLQRANTVKDVLAVEAELTRVQTRIDSLAARRKHIREDVALSAITLELVPAEEDRILGPLGLLYVGTRWFITKLFVIRP